MRPALILALGALLTACTSGSEPDPAAASAAAAAAPAPAAPAPVPAGPTITEVPPVLEISAELVAYGSTADSVLDGYFVLPSDVVEPAPGILLIHDQWGLDETIRALSRRLAGEGYAVLAIDLLAGRTAAGAGEAGILMAGLEGERAAILDNIRQAHDFLEQSAVAPRIAALGFGFGGDWALEAALELGEGLDAVVIFYGQVSNDRSRLENLRAPLLGLYAAQDDRVPVREATRFRSTLRDLEKTAIVLIHSNVGRGFANPAAPAYAHDAAVESWASTLEFLSSQLKEQ